MNTICSEESYPHTTLRPHQRAVNGFAFKHIPEYLINITELAIDLLTSYPQSQDGRGNCVAERIKT